MKTSFIANPHHPRLGDLLRTALKSTQWTEFRAAVAFVRQSGTRRIATELAEFAQRGKVSISIGIDQGGSSLEGLMELLDAVGPSGKLWAFKNSKNTFHPKLYLFKGASAAEVFIGSGNLTKGGLYENDEAIARTELNLAHVDDRAFLKAVENSLKHWGTAKRGLCMALDASVIERLPQTEDLPTEAEQLMRARATRSGTNAKAPSLFTGEDVPPAPRARASKPSPQSVTVRSAIGHGAKQPAIGSGSGSEVRAIGDWPAMAAQIPTGCPWHLRITIRRKGTGKPTHPEIVVPDALVMQHMRALESELVAMQPAQRAAYLTEHPHWPAIAGERAVLAYVKAGNAANKVGDIAGAQLTGKPVVGWLQGGRGISEGCIYEAATMRHPLWARHGAGRAEVSPDDLTSEQISKLNENAERHCVELPPRFRLSKG